MSRDQASKYDIDHSIWTTLTIGTQNGPDRPMDRLSRSWIHGTKLGRITQSSHIKLLNHLDFHTTLIMLIGYDNKTNRRSENDIKKERKKISTSRLSDFKWQKMDER